MARRRKANPWLWRALGVLVLAALVGGGWLWWDTRQWAPPEAEFPQQGSLVGHAQGAVSFRALKALGADFVYLVASRGARTEDTAFVRNYAAARAAGLQVGALHVFDPCTPADGQSANFVTMVPRAGDLLPPAIALDRTAADCPGHVGDAAVESELMTLINQIENHAGKPAILKLSPEFEATYHVSSRIERNLWLTRTRLAPAYAQRPWVLWSANAARMTAAGKRPIEWVVVQP